MQICGEYDPYAPSNQEMQMDVDKSRSQNEPKQYSQHNTGLKSARMQADMSPKGNLDTNRSS